MDYDHGKRVTQHYYELSPLELAITEFESKAKSHYTSASKIPENETPKQREHREKELAEALSHLRLERLRALTKIQVHSRLEEYQRAAQEAVTGTRKERREAREVLANENHHPTDKLVSHMRADGRPQPSPRFTAHHIVQGKGKTEAAAFARVELHMHGVGINDPDNGCWMPRYKADRGHWAYPNAAAHSQIHTHNYEAWVYRHVQFLDNTQAMRDALRGLRTHLKNGTQPLQVTQKPDKDWEGI